MNAPRGPAEKDTCRNYVVPKLESSGWAGRWRPEVPVVAENSISSGASTRRVRDGRADYVLEAVPGVPVAVVEAKRLYASYTDGLQQAISYADRLDVGLVYSTNGRGIRERDLAAGTERDVEAFPTPAEMWARHVEVNELDVAAQTAIGQPFNRSLIDAGGTTVEPRSYQVTAVHRVLRAIASGQRRALLLMATGTGKTFTALQVVAKLQAYWKGVDPDRNRRVLYLADRDSLVKQPMEKTFRRAMGDGSLVRVRGGAPMGKDIYFATYQALDGGTSRSGEVRTLLAYPSNYFDLVIVDECHRGSATKDSRWRQVLNHFSPAVQLGLTATPKQDDGVDTYEYFGPPVFEYSLRQGIEDGYLAPYRVRRAYLSTDVEGGGWRPSPGQLDMYGKEIPDRLYTTRDFERVVALLSRTTTAAKHLSNLLRAHEHPRAIVFCVNVEHAEGFRRAMVEVNQDRVAADPTWVVRITGEDGETGRTLLQSFCDMESRSPVVATTSRMLSTGVDVEDLTHVVLFRPVGSMVEFKQIIGRGSRLYPERGKTSFEVVDYVRATKLFEDPQFDGPPLNVKVVEVDLDGDEVEVGEPPGPGTTDGGTDGVNAPGLEEPKPGYEAGGSGTFEPPPRAERERAEKYVVEDGGVVTLTAEGFYVPDTSTGRLRLVQYTEYVGQRVRRLFDSSDDLRAAWPDRERRRALTDALAREGIVLGELQERTGSGSADVFDMLVEAAWNLPPLTRAQRADRVRRGLDVEEDLDARARKVLDVLLDRYSEHGLDDVTDPLALDIEPLRTMGTPVEISRWFSGRGGYQTAITDLQDRLYAA